MNEPNNTIPTATETVWLVHIEKLISLTDVMTVTQYHDQDWHFHQIDNYYSGMIMVSKTFEIKADYIECYIEALKSCNDFTVAWYEKKK